MQLEMVSPQDLKDSKIETIPFHSHHAIDLAIIFVYGDDIERQQKNIFISVGGKKSARACALFHLLATAVLCYVRKRERIPRNGFIWCWLDINCSFFGGGNIRITHRYEKWLFGIVYIANFFLMAIYSGLVLLESGYERDQSIKSIEEITSIDPPIFINPDFEQHEKDVIDTLRFDLRTSLQSHIRIF